MDELFLFSTSFVCIFHTVRLSVLNLNMIIRQMINVTHLREIELTVYEYEFNVDMNIETTIFSDKID